MSRFQPPICQRLLLALAASAACSGWVAPAGAADAPPPAKAAAKPPAKAADAKPSEGSLGKGGGSGPLLTREQLRQCLAEQERLKQEGASLVETQAVLAKDRGEIDRLGAEITADLATLDRTSEPAVDAYNTKVRDRTKRAEAYQAAASAFNQRADKLEADRPGFAKDCADRRYDEADLNALKAGK